MVRYAPTACDYAGCSAGVCTHGASKACNDGADNDGDGLVDILDPGCTNADDTDESNTSSCNNTLLWQLFQIDYTPSAADLPAHNQYVDTFDYTVVGTGSLLPAMPGLMHDQKPAGITQDAVRHLNVRFHLNNTLTAGQFILHRAGSESVTVFIDGTYANSTVATEGANRVFKITVPTLSPGDHTITLNYEGGGADNGAYLDALAVVGCQTPTSSSSSSSSTPPSTLTLTQNGAASIMADQNVSYTIVLGNTGPAGAVAQNVYVVDTMSGSLAFVSESSSPECEVDGSAAVVRCGPYTVPSGTAGQKIISVTFESLPLRCGFTARNTVSASTTAPWECSRPAPGWTSSRTTAPRTSSRGGSRRARDSAARACRGPP